MTHPPQEGQTLVGSMFNEPMRVAAVRAGGTRRWMLGLVGLCELKVCCLSNERTRQRSIGKR